MLATAARLLLFSFCFVTAIVHCHPVPCMMASHVGRHHETYHHYIIGILHFWTVVSKNQNATFPPFRNRPFRGIESPKDQSGQNAFTCIVLDMNSCKQNPAFRRVAKHSSKLCSLFVLAQWKEQRVSRCVLKVIRYGNARDYRCFFTE